jgi:putative permease
MDRDSQNKPVPKRKNGIFQFFRDWLDRHFSDPQVLILSFLLVFGFIVIFKLGGMLIPVFVSIIIAYLLDGIIGRLAFLKIPRIAAVLIVFLLFLASMIMLLVGLLPLLSQQIAQLVQQFPSMISSGQKELMRLPERYPGFVSEAQIAYVLEFVGSELTSLMKRVLSLSIASVRGFISVLVYLILVPLMVFFLLKDKHKILNWINSILPDHRGLATEVWREVNQQTGNYIRGKIWEILIIWGISM